MKTHKAAVLGQDLAGLNALQSLGCFPGSITLLPGVPKAHLSARFGRGVAYLLFAIAIFFGTHARAQLSTAEVSGDVHDSTNAIIPGATVTATQAATGFVETTTSNSDGLFVFATLPVGSYTITVAAPGFESYRQVGLTLTVGEHVTVRAALKIGAADQSVTVDATTVALDTTAPTVQSIVEQKIVENLPLNGRNAATLAYTVAGVNDAAQNQTARTINSSFAPSDAVSSQESAPSVHGARPGGTYFSLDGANNTDPFSVVGGPFPNPDATGEFSVVTGTYGAQYTSAPGGAINIVSRSGTNKIHGTAFEFIRNGYFNAENRYAATPDVLKRNQFGGAVGAPVLKDRLFVFGTYQGTIQRNALTSSGFFPTAAERTGDFGSFQIPSFLLSPVALKMLQYLPVGRASDGFVSIALPDNSTDKQGLVKFDLDVKKHRVFARVFYDRFDRGAAGPTAAALEAGGRGGLIQTWGSGAIGDTWTAGKFTLQTSASFVQVLADTTPIPNDDFTYSKLGITNLNGEAPNPGIGLAYVLGDFGVGGGNASQFPRRELEISQNVFATIGKHQLSFGGSYRHINLDENNFTGENPIPVYVGVNSSIYGQIGVIPGATFNPLADFLLGAPYQFFQQDGFFTGVTGNLFGLYGEDNFHITNKLTATTGMRWDPSFAYTPKLGRINCFTPGVQSTVFTNATPGLTYPGDPGCAKSGVPSTLAEFQPRVGLAYAANAVTVVRAGFGRYDLQLPLNAYTGFSAQPFVRTFTFAQPFISIDNVYGSLMTPDPFAAGFQTASFKPAKDAAFVTGVGASTFDQNFHPAYVDQWSLSLQQALSPADSVEIAYIGTAGVHLSLGISENTAVNGKVPYSDFGHIIKLASTGTSSYNGVDVTYRHRSKIFTVTSAFSWSKALDDNSEAVSAGTVNLPFDDHNFRRGRSDFDQDLVFRNTFTATSPRLQNLNYAARSVLGSWSLSGLAIVDAGQPFSVTDAGDHSQTGLGLDYADRVSGVPLYVNGKLNFNAFTDNATGTFGNSGRNAYRGASNKDVDIAAQKEIPLRKEFNLLFRAEAFNVFNHPNNEPVASYNAWSPTAGPTPTSPGTFGVYTTARDPRIMQFSLKASF